MLKLIEKKGLESGKIKPFQRTAEFESDSLREAMIAAGAVQVTTDNSETGGRSEATPIFDNALSRYKHILQQAKTRPLTAREEAIKAEYEATEEYRMVFGYYESVINGGVTG